MKQILQNLRDGSTEVAEVPCPRLAPGHLLLRTTRTLISDGTERMLVEFGKANPLAKARQQPWNLFVFALNALDASWVSPLDGA